MEGELAVGQPVVGVGRVVDEAVVVAAQQPAVGYRGAAAEAEGGVVVGDVPTWSEIG